MISIESIRNGALLACALLLGACVPKVVTPPVVPPSGAPVTPPAPPPKPVPYDAIAAGVSAGPDIVSLGLERFPLDRALQAFRLSCRSVMTRVDGSGLTRPGDWAEACAAAASEGVVPSQFFTTYFETALVGRDPAFATGYYEPQISGSRTKAPGYEVPIYAKPSDLLDNNPLTAAAGRGRLNENGEYVLYYERGEIEDGALANKGLEIAWAADPIELFFLQIQGSGRLLQPDGSIMRIGYAGQNGREYVAIGRIMRERAILQTGTTMQDIVAWLRANPEEGRAIMRENKSYIFFKELTGSGPLGALGVPVTARATVAADPKFVPLGAPVFLSLDRLEANGIWVAQDTGGAIKGPNRFDTFWGAGAEEARIAGGMSARGAAYILLPKGTLARLTANAPPPQP